MTTEDDFHRHLDQHPDDHHARLVFADFLQEQGDPRAEGYRALGMLKRSPIHNNGYGAWLTAIDKDPMWSMDAEPGTLPRDWETLTPSHFNHGNRRKAEDAAALAFSKLPQQRREELLGQQSEKLSRRTYSRRTGRRYA